MLQKPLVIYTTCHPWVQAVVQEVAPADFAVHFLDLNDPVAAAEWLPRADFLVCLRLSPIQASLLKRCQLVMHNGVGYDAIDQRTLHEMGVPLAVTPAMTAETVAEHTLMMMLALSKQLIPAHISVQKGGFDLFGWRERSHTLFGKTVGIVGLGRIGKRVAHLAHAFGCQVIYNDLVAAAAELEQRLYLTRVSFEEILTTADVLTVHVPLTPLTKKMFGAAEFAQMKPDALYINASRGGTYDLDALYKSLVDGHLRGAGLDVFEPEPPPVQHPILQLPHVVCTPHIASGTVERQYAINRAQFANCQRVLAGQRPLDEVVWEG